MKAIIVDDERLARKELTSLLENHPEIEIMDEAANADEALEKMAISTERPTMMINDLGQASQTGQDVQSPLMSKCLLTMLEAKKASISAVRSAIRSWHAFAATVIRVPLTNTLQPVCSLHVMMWLCCLKNHGTAQHYYGHLVFFVKFMGGDTSWRDDRMELYMKRA